MTIIELATTNKTKEPLRDHKSAKFGHDELNSGSGFHVGL